MAQEREAFSGRGRPCRNCGATITEDARYCPGCGTSAALAGEEYTGFWIRGVAFVIDAILIGVVRAIVTAVSGLPVLGSIISILDYVLFIGLKGQTPGKKVFGIEVVNSQGNAPGIVRAVLREILGKIISALAILIGFFWIAWDPRKRGWHDYIAGTYVVRAL